jgi:murein DD-endopeptidase MepM/ murein hydrolase activator NlpD
MLAPAFWSRFGRCAFFALGASSLLFAGGCSTGSRFDFSSLGYNSSEPQPLADPTPTASLPVPQESVYASSGSSSAYRSPPPQYYGGNDGSYSRPGGPATYQQATYAPPPPVAPRAAPRPMPRTNTGLTVRVEQGDSLYSIARRYDVPVGEIQEANGMSDVRISVGQKLIIPGVHKPAPGQVASRSPKPVGTPPQPDVRAVKTTTIAAPAAPATPAAKVTKVSVPAGPQPEPSMPSAPAAADATGGGASSGQIASVDRLPQAEPMSGSSFRWPVQGRIVSAFGTKPDGGHNDGIDVAVPMGTSVLAAENGVVAYAGEELKGYGNLVLVRHANNWVSAYANNEEILVKRGDQVQRGQVIAKAGRSGQASQPQLHFELRKGSRPVDPTKYMTSTQANAN